MMAAPTSVFDDMDDVTAQICIALQLDDIATVREQRASSASSPSDEDIAFQVSEDDLKSYRVLRGFEEREPSKEQLEELSEELSEEPPTPPTFEDKPTNLETLPPTNIALFDCAACGERFNAEECVAVPCKHYYCDGCLDDLFTHSMRDRTLYPPRCCRQIIPWDTIRYLVSDRLATQFEVKKEELDDKNPVYCHDKQCSEYINADAQDSTKATCPTCLAETCTLCKQGAHAGAYPEDEEVQKMREYAKAEGNQECAQCHQLVELSTGCNHITCLCKYEFCYCCGIAWKNCPCEQWDEDRLTARADAVANRPGMGGAVAAPRIAEELRRNHRDCDDEGHGWMQKIDGRIMCDSCGVTQGKFIFRCYHCHTELCHRCKNNRA